MYFYNLTKVHTFIKDFDQYYNATTDWIRRYHPFDGLPMDSPEWKNKGLRVIKDSNGRVFLTYDQDYVPIKIPKFVKATFVELRDLIDGTHPATTYLVNHGTAGLQYWNKNQKKELILSSTQTEKYVSLVKVKALDVLTNEYITIKFLLSDMYLNEIVESVFIRPERKPTISITEQLVSEKTNSEIKELVKLNKLNNNPTYKLKKKAKEAIEFKNQQINVASANIDYYTREIENLFYNIEKHKKYIEYQKTFAAEEAASKELLQKQYDEITLPEISIKDSDITYIDNLGFKIIDLQRNSLNEIKELSFISQQRIINVVNVKKELQQKRIGGPYLIKYKDGYWRIFNIKDTFIAKRNVEEWKIHPHCESSTNSKVREKSFRPCLGEVDATLEKAVLSQDLKSILYLWKVWLESTFESDGWGCDYVLFPIPACGTPNVRRKPPTKMAHTSVWIMKVDYRKYVYLYIRDRQITIPRWNYNHVFENNTERNRHLKLIQKQAHDAKIVIKRKNAQNKELPANQQAINTPNDLHF